MIFIIKDRRLLTVNRRSKNMTLKTHLPFYVRLLMQNIGILVAIFMFF